MRHCDSYIPGFSGDLIETEMSIFSPGGKHPTSNLSDTADLPSDIRLPCVNLNVQPTKYRLSELKFLVYFRIAEGAFPTLFTFKEFSVF